MRLRLAFFLAAFALALAATAPLGLAAGRFARGGQGLAARGAEGSLWNGTLIDARFGPVALGDIDAGLDPLALLAGRVRLSFSGDGGGGMLSASRGGRWRLDLAGPGGQVRRIEGSF